MPPFPTRISRYDIKSLIGTGGMGTLYLARDTNPNTNRLVALKLLNTNLDFGDLRERFAREARALAALNHPNVVNIYDSGEFQGSPFIVMEYVRGETLSEKIKRKAPLSLRQKLKLMGELCAGLGHAHDAGMIHRDIKPANLMVDQHGRLKILDFGIARVQEGSFTRAGLQVTQFNVRIGTPGNMSPEQIETGEIDRRSDIFAVGAVFYELLSYSEAFSGASTRQIENKVLQTQPAPLVSLVPDLDPEIAAIVARALEKEADKRYQDAADMQEALEQQLWRLGRLDTPAPTARPTPTPSPQGARTSRDSRAELAFQRSVAFFREGAADAARRSAIEALAEDPGHEGAFAFLERLERQEPDRWPLPRILTPAPATEARTAVEGSTVARTALESPGRSFTPVPPTIVSPRRDLPAARSARRWPGLPELWNRYRTAALVAAAIALTAGSVLIVMRVINSPSAPGQLLTVVKPTGGTITGSGINCGTAGSDCSITVRDGEAVELQTRADAGFMFTGYTGDCLSTGRTLMTSPRTCGGTFAPLPELSAQVPRILTISRPKGGTILSAGIQCGTLGADCSATHPDGEQITLAARADEGFTFQGFSGDCNSSGSARSTQVLMNAPRTCGATFIARAATGASPPPPAAAGPSATRPPGAGGDGAGPVTPTFSPTPGPIASGGGGAEPAVAEAAPVAPPISAEQVAKGNIDRLLKEYCSAYTNLDVPGIVRVFPTAPVSGLNNQFRQYKTAGCELMGPADFKNVDPGAGIATIEVPVKLLAELKVGGARPPQETVAIVKFVRPESRGSWFIESLTYRAKR